MLTGLFGQSSTCAAACPQRKNVPSSTRATRVLRDLSCAVVPTTRRRKTALGGSITTALSDTSIPFAAIPFAAIARRTSATCVQRNAGADPLPSSWRRPRHGLPMEKRAGSRGPSAREHVHLFAQRRDQRPA